VGVAPLHPEAFTDEETGDGAALANAAGTPSAVGTAGAAGVTGTGAAATTGAAGTAGADRAAGASRLQVSDRSGPPTRAGLTATVPSALAATIVARMDPRTKLKVGDRARVQLDLSALHFFDPETGTSLRD
jgi:hypothetical protein